MLELRTWPSLKATSLINRIFRIRTQVCWLQSPGPSSLPTAFEMTNGTGHLLSTAGLIQWVQELKSTTCSRDIKSSRTSSGVGKMMNSSMRQPGSFLQRPCFTEVHASSKSLYVQLSHQTTPPKINNEHKNGDELLLMLSWEGMLSWRKGVRFWFIMFFHMQRLLSRSGHGLSVRSSNETAQIQWTNVYANWATNTCQALSKELPVQFCIFPRISVLDLVGSQFHKNKYIYTIYAWETDWKIFLIKKLEIAIIA